MVGRRTRGAGRGQVMAWAMTVAVLATGAALAVGGVLSWDSPWWIPVALVEVGALSWAGVLPLPNPEDPVDPGARPGC